MVVAFVYSVYLFQLPFLNYVTEGYGFPPTPNAMHTEAEWHRSDFYAI